MESQSWQGGAEELLELAYGTAEGQLCWAAKSLHKTMQCIIIFQVFHYGRLTLANSILTL